MDPVHQLGPSETVHLPRGFQAPSGLSTQVFAHRLKCTKRQCTQADQVSEVGNVPRYDPPGASSESDVIVQPATPRAESSEVSELTELFFPPPTIARKEERVAAVGDACGVAA